MHGRKDGAERTRVIRVPDGVVACDESGTFRFALRDSAFETGGSDLRLLALAHLASMHDDARASSGAAGGEGEGEETRRSEASDPPGPRRAACPPSDVHVLPAVGYLSTDLKNRAVRAWCTQGKVLPVVRRNGRAFVGPLLDPPVGPCILCVQRAVAPNRQAELLLDGRTTPIPDRPLEEAGARLVATQASELVGGILELDATGRVIERHHVRRFADCPLCGDVRARRHGKGLVLKPRPKHPESDTGARVTAPGEVVERYRHLVSPLSGAIRHLREVDAGAPGRLHVWSASHAMAMSASSVSDLVRDIEDHSGGKGCSRQQAKASALCEALERFSAVYRDGDVDVVAPMKTLPFAIAPNDLMLFSDRQLADRDAANAAATSRFQHVPLPFDPNAPVAWSRLHPLTASSEAFVPTSLLHFGFRGPHGAFARADSNGLAAGQTTEEALLQGFLELVERDAVAVWWYNRLRVPAVDVASFHDPAVDDMLACYDEAGRDAWVLDVTSDLGIPTFVAVSARRSGAPEVIFGFGAHLDPAIALRRCVTEMNQLLATVRRPRAQRVAHLRGGFRAALEWWRDATLEHHLYLTADPARPKRRAGDWPFAATDDILDDVHTCLEVAEQNGLCVYVREMTRADLGLPVVKVVVPGLRHFWRRLAPGRLYDAPVAAGVRSRPLTEEEVNPVALFV